MKPSRFVIHEHHATNLHFDFRLEIAGVLKSWAVPKGVSLNPNEKRLAVVVPDHAVSYIDFEGTLAEGTYGAGEVRIWDNGEFEIVGGQLEKGKLIFRLFGKKLQGEFALLRMKGNERNWLLIKSKDEFADLNWKLETVLPLKNKKAKS
ncbi:MAG TPA: DNA polymerase ligase N-terminal domain-containing protein [Pyrinomonadaceae bacterium]|jgi:bifunctional non-homologous end joining protein LigD